MDRRCAGPTTSMMTLPLSVMNPARSRGVPPRRASSRITYARAIGITSTGSGKLSESLDQLAAVRDAYEGARDGGDDLLARERSATALDHREARVDFVGTVDVHGDLGDLVEVDHSDAARFESSRRALGTRYGGRHRYPRGRQGVDEEVDGRAGARRPGSRRASRSPPLPRRLRASIRPESWRSAGVFSMQA